MELEDILEAGRGDRLFLLGNEAAVRAAIESGVGVASTYPGTPSSEIGNVLSKIAKRAGIYFEFSINEKVALEVAAAAAASGVRSFTFMKHVGLNVASDSFMSVAYTGVRAGMVVLSADDPSMFSSQNEQDNRHYARLAAVPLLEPSSPQEILEYMNHAFELSEEYGVPVLLRTTTRVSHMRGVVEVGERRAEPVKGFFRKNPEQFVPVPATARVMHRELVEKMKKLKGVADASKLNRVLNDDAESALGIIASGGAFNYVYDALQTLGLDIPVLKLGFTYPFPSGLVAEFLSGLEGVLVVEEVDPVMEKEVLAVAASEGLDVGVHGKLDGTLPEIYEYSEDIVRRAISGLAGIRIHENKIEAPELPERPPALCPGCPHRAMYYSVRRAATELGIQGEDLIFPTDIGCYTLGIEPPYSAADYLLSMGSSVGTSCGFSAATSQRIVSFIGDSTFFHAGIPPLINAVHNRQRFVLVILDNRTTAMTGGQPHPGLPVDGMGEEAPAISIEDIARACGVEFVETVNPMNIRRSSEIIGRALQHESVAVVISRYPCMLSEGAVRGRPVRVDEERCDLCLECLNELACPAMVEEDGRVLIDPLHCRGCTVCLQICPAGAIRPEGKR
ncbi:indolepyruvate ferredoxin oxidoreductase subunit alpha [Methanothermobacter sp.]|uniref:indolepyruvate ferredoxin oxidoreductase subunit alpha n=1 Tax=Methanothermobacter sp. TaxID=1884223 RepID=UPI003C744EC9